MSRGKAATIVLLLAVGSGWPSAFALQSPERQARVAYAAAKIALSEGDAAVALQKFEEVIAALGPVPELLYYAAEAALQAGLRTKAQDYADRAFAVDDLQFEQSPEFARLVELLARLELRGASSSAPPLPVGGFSGKGMITNGVAAYSFDARSPGVLSVAVAGDGDLVIEVLDSDGQVTRQGSSDRDLFGQLGHESLSVYLAEAGVYQVRLRLLDGPETFEVGWSWLQFSFGVAPDSDGRPSRATPVQVGREVKDGLSGRSGDLRDWFVVTPPSDGILSVRTLADGDNDDLDLILELFETDFSRPAATSDQDLQGSKARESATLAVARGQPIYIRVSAFDSSGTGAYRLLTAVGPSTE